MLTFLIFILLSVNAHPDTFRSSLKDRLDVDFRSNLKSKKAFFDHVKFDFDAVFKEFTPDTFLDAYSKYFSKNYVSKDERRYRLNIFKENAEHIREFNKGKKEFKLGLTPFLDLDFNEFKHYYLMDESTSDFLCKKASQEKGSRRKRRPTVGTSADDEALSTGRKLQGFSNSGWNFIDFWSDRPTSTQSVWKSNFFGPSSFPFNNQSNTRAGSKDNSQYASSGDDEKPKSQISKSKETQTTSARQFNYPRSVFKDYTEAEQLINKRSYRIKDYARYINWAEAGFVSDIRDQKKCASCYIFSAIAALESLALIHNKKRLDLSEQELVDCSTKYNNQGCKGGLQSFVFDYIIDNGVTFEENYPYTNSEKECGVGAVRKTRFPNLDYIHLDNHVMAIIAALNYGPVTVAHFATPMFPKYSEGVMDETVCQTDMKSPNHSTLFVGYHLDDPTPHFIVKNSWGSAWGEKGYFKIKIGELSTKNKGLCGMANFDINVMPILVRNVK